MIDSDVHKFDCFDLKKKKKKKGNMNWN
jgi:hypothetical protein